jgi:glucoside 3-dehydrogenase (cytochrome c) catalytic subunit
MAQRPTSPKFDVIVVGSGASGGWAAKRLSEAGVHVALVDCGRPHGDEDFTEHKPAWELKYRDRADTLMRQTRPVQKDCYACMEYNAHWFANDLEEPYSTPDDKPFSWQGRLRVIGGRTNVWGRQSYRLSDLDFKATSHDGYDADWPISYADLAPYYDIVEEYVGISGQTEGVAELPDGKFQPPMPMTCAETRLRTRVKQKLGRTVTIGRTANLTKPINGRQACHYCGPCERGCVTHSYFNSAFTTVADALKTGKYTLIPNAMAWQVLTDPGTHRATGIRYVDRNTREAKKVYARAVVLCAQALESVRILLNSANREYPNGLANSSGALGHYLMDHHSVSGAFGGFADLEPDRPRAGGPNRPNGIYVIRFRNTPNGPQQKDFIRGYGFQGGGGSHFNFDAPGYGAAYKKALLTQPQSGISLGGFGETLAKFDNFVEIDPSGAVDAFGIPTLKIHMKFGDNELAMMKDMAATAAEMLEAAGAVGVRSYVQPNPVPGWGIHEVGIARMGDDPKTSVLTQFCRTHDIDNLYVMDGSAFVSIACQNPTLTIMALAVRSTDHLLDEMKKGNV